MFRAVLALLVAGGLGLDGSAAHAAGTYYVDTQHPSASNTNPGTEALPYKTISGAAAVRSGAGTVIIVKPGTYRETVAVPASGALNNHYVFQASGPGVVVDGSDDFSGVSKWALLSGNVYRAASVNWAPLQVFVDGVRLSPSVASPASIPPQSFTYVGGSNGGLYVNLGGTNPGARETLVGRRAYGIRLSGRTFVTIQGFTVTRAEDRALYLSNSANNNVIRANTVNNAYRYGIALNACSGVLVEQNIVSQNQDHGISLTASCSNCTVKDNESFNNVHPTARQANGLYLNRSTNNLLHGNRLHHNQDTGVQLSSSSDNNRSIQNISWSNGDHGFDHLNSAGSIIIGCIAWGNYKDGFSIEGTSSGARLYNSIAIDNGINVLPADGSLANDLWVDSQSATGFVSDYNIFWNSTSQAPVKYINTSYTSVAAYSAARNQDSHSLQLNPRFTAPAAGNFELLSNSPAIDAAHSGVAQWPATDALGRARIDDPTIPNTGAGGITFADRGALEFQAVTSLPFAALNVSPSSGLAPLSVIADASGSTSPNGAISSYRFDFGDGTIVGPQSSPQASHTYAVGTWIATVTVTDVLGYTASASDTTSAQPLNQPANGVMETPAANVTIAVGQLVNFTGVATDAEGNTPLSFAWNFGGGAPNSTLEDPGPVIFNTAGTYSVTFTATDALGNVDPTPDVRTITVNVAPTGTAADEIHWTITGQTAAAFDWRGFDNTIRYGLTPAYGTTVTAVTPNPLPWSSAGPFWEAQLSGLQENTLYHYSIGNGPDHTFRTPPVRGTSGFTIFAQGDVGDASSYSQLAPIQAMIAAGAPAFTLMLGDLTYGGTNSLTKVDAHFNDMMVWSRDAAYMPVWGNHEYEEGDDLRNYKGRFALPNPQTSPGSPTAGGEDWSWFDYGNVRFISYPEPFSGAWSLWRTQAGTLMDEAQADPAIKFIVTFGHRPAYSSGSHEGEAGLQANLDALGDGHSKYVLNLNGHSHDYERTHPQHGVTHITAGTGGSTLGAVPGPCVWGGGCPPPAFSAFRAMHHVAFKLTFTATTIQGQALCGPSDSQNDITCTPGTVIDSFLIGDQPPVVTAPASASLNEGQTLTINVTASDPNADAITTLAASGMPAGATFTPGAGNTSGVLSWTPSNEQSGTYTVTFTASNALSGATSTVITVADSDRAPVVTAPATVSGTENSVISFGVTAADPDGDAITSLVATNLPAGATFAPAAGNSSGTLAWTPGYAQAGSFTVTFTASNALSGAASTSVTVNNVDRAPVVSAAATASGPENSELLVAVTVSDPDGDAISSLSATGLPAGATFTPGAGNTSGTLAWTPSFTQAGAYAVTFNAANALSGSASTDITVSDLDRAPVVSAPASAGVLAGNPVTVLVTASDPDGDAIASLTSATLPDGATFTPSVDNTSGTFSWTPTTNDVGEHTLDFTASNSLSGSASTVLSVSAEDRAPIVTAPASTGGRALEPIGFSVTAADPDGHSIASLEVTGLPTGAVFTPGAGNASGSFAWTPGEGDVGDHTVTFTATNALTGSASTVISVAPADQPPVVTAPATASVNENQVLTVDVTVSDANGDAISSLTTSALPAGATFTPGVGNTSGTLNWQPGFIQSGSYSITFTASNALSGSASTSLTVVNMDRAPVVTAPATAAGNAGTPLTVNVTASDPDGDAITSLSPSGLPAGASFTPGAGNTTGTLSWTPGAGDVGEHDITFTANNVLSGSASTSITVTNVDAPPVVTAPATVSGKAGTSIAVNVTATDPDGQSITSLTASPRPGTVFTTGAGNTSGTFTWTPATGDVGTHEVTFTATNTLTGTATTQIQVLPPNQAPVAELTASPAGGNAPVTTIANATGSTDADGTIASYQFDFGDGFVTSPQASAISPGHTYAAGNWTLTVTVTDNEGGTGTKSIPIVVAAVPSQPNLVGNPSFETGTTGWGPYSTGTLARVAGGFDGGWSLQITGNATLTSMGCNDSPNWVTTVSAAGQRYRFTAWVRSVAHVGTAKLQVREYLNSVKVGSLYSPGVVITSTWQPVTVDYITTNAGSSLDFQVIDYPTVPNEVFLTDNISIRNVTGTGPALAGGGDALESGPAPGVVADDLAGRVPLRASLSPSPLRARSVLSFVTTRPGPLVVELYEITGRRARVLADGAEAPAGLHQLTVDARDERGGVLSPGIYFYRITAAEGRSTGRIVFAP